MKRVTLFITCVMFTCAVQLNAQIGYQVSLLNSATGEPRANETVSVTLKLTNSEGTVVCNETKSATTNEFGVLSLSIGNSHTFENMDWSKLPLYISATVDDVMIGKSQILTVPVAEAAKTLVNVDPELICKTWNGEWHPEGCTYTYKLTLTSDKTFSFSAFDQYGNNIANCSGKYIVQGCQILLCQTSGYGQNGTYLLTSFVYNEGKLYGSLDYAGNIEFY